MFATVANPSHIQAPLESLLSRLVYLIFGENYLNKLGRGYILYRKTST
jgi:hypothetical protein